MTIHLNPVVIMFHQSFASFGQHQQLNGRIDHAITDGPPQRDKEYIEQFGCHLVPVGHPLSARKSLEWRLSFSIAERTLVWSFNHTQLQCYAVMKLILKEYVKTKCTEKHKSVSLLLFYKNFSILAIWKDRPIVLANHKSTWLHNILITWIL